MNKKNLRITERRNEVRNFLYCEYIGKIMTMFGFEVDQNYENSGNRVRWIHPQTGWSMFTHSEYDGMAITDGNGTKIPGDAQVLKQIAADGIYDWTDGYFKADYESPLEEVFQILLHYLTDEEIISALRYTTAMERDDADRDMANEGYDNTPNYQPATPELTHQVG